MNEPLQRPLSRIVIVGGGSAGWLTAGLLASRHRTAGERGVQITLVESPDVATIGVGEGTWPTMRASLEQIGISELEFLRECSSAFKQGTQFRGWVTGQADDEYYHPFTAPTGYAEINLVPHWLAQRDSGSFAQAVSAQSYICDASLAPKQATTPPYAGVLNYGYHLDAGKFAGLLQRHCTTQLGVRHVLDHVTCINNTADGDIASVSTTHSGDLPGDLFIDCTGLSALLLGRHYRVPFIDKADVLFNDSALAVPVDYSSAQSPIASQTLSIAQSAGWIWDIGLTTRRGVGYTYSSQHTTDEVAEAVLHDYVARTAPSALPHFEARKISFRPGYRACFWHRNCVAVGMSAGFLEPLEASALVLVELAATMIGEELPVHRGVMDIIARRYNEKFLYRWERVIDFLKLHYVLSRREGPYWVDHRQASSIPERLQELLHLWEYHAPWHSDFHQRDEIFSSASYQYILYGMGFSTRASVRLVREVEAARAAQLFAENRERAGHLLHHLPGHRELLRRLLESGSAR